MARLTQVPITPKRSVSNPDSLTDLTRLLARLQQSILHADAEREHRLRTSEYERSKARINIQYARTLLTKLEQDALVLKVHSSRQAVQADLNQKREVYEQLEERLREIEDISINSDEDDSDEGEDLLSEIIPTPSQSSDSRSGEYVRDELGDEHEEGWDKQDEDDAVMPEPTSAAPPSWATSTTTSEASSTQAQSQQTASISSPPNPEPTGTTISPMLRARGSAAHNTQQATSSATDTALTTNALRSQLFSESQSAPATTSTTTATAEAILDHHRAEQDKLTESMVSMAQALKASTHAFSSALQQDKDVLDSAGKGLDRNERGLENVSGRMGTLRRLTEGEGWWGRLMLYAWIAGLAFFAVVLVFVFPKLRF